MANLKEIRTRITSVKSTRQITSAMKMVAASKLRRAQDAVIRLRPYADKLHEILEHISAVTDAGDDNQFSQERDASSVLIVVITSNKGLCGAFNANVVKSAMNIAQIKYKSLLESGNLDFMTIGKKAGDILKAKGYKIAENRDNIYNNLSFDNVKLLAEELMQSFISKKYDKIVIVYNQFKNAASQILTEEQFLPVEQKEKDTKIKHDYIFEPTKEYIVETLIPDSLKIQLYKAILDSNAAEHGARMTAMHQATDNASEMIKDLTLRYNKARQSSITNEILEIVAGANALKS